MENSKKAIDTLNIKSCRKLISINPIEEKKV